MGPMNILQHSVNPHTLPAKRMCASFARSDQHQVGAVAAEAGGNLAS